MGSSNRHWIGSNRLPKLASRGRTGSPFEQCKFSKAQPELLSLQHDRGVQVPGREAGPPQLHSEGRRRDGEDGHDQKGAAETVSTEVGGLQETGQSAQHTGEPAAPLGVLRRSLLLSIYGQIAIKHHKQAVPVLPAGPLFRRLAKESASIFRQSPGKGTALSDPCKEETVDGRLGLSRELRKMDFLSQGTMGVLAQTMKLLQSAAGRCLPDAFF
jgi:hypothetical protein